MNEVSFVCLVIVAAVCVLGIFSEKFADNWMQFLGMWGVLLWACARAYQVWDGANITPQQVLAHVSLALFALGTLQKVRKHNRKAKPPEPPAPYKLEPEQLKHVAGGRK